MIMRRFKRKNHSLLQIFIQTVFKKHLSLIIHLVTIFRSFPRDLFLIVQLEHIFIMLVIDHFVVTDEVVNVV